MSKRDPGKYERRDRDYYPTPPKAVLPLVPHLRAARLRRFCEPCAGNGALIRHLEAARLTCVLAGDIATGQDALDIPSFPAPIITNPPYERRLMHRLIERFIAVAPSAWLLLELDWTATKQAASFMPRCSHVVPIGRVKWIEDSQHPGFDNFAWCRFTARHSAGPILYPLGVRSGSSRVLTCTQCQQPFPLTRSDAKFCSHACRQQAYRERLSVT